MVKYFWLHVTHTWAFHHAVPHRVSRTELTSVALSDAGWSEPFFLGSVWPFHPFTFDLVARLCPAAGLTLAVQPAVSLEGKPSQKFALKKDNSSSCDEWLLHCSTQPAEDGVIDLDDIAKRSFPIRQMVSLVVSASVKDWTRSLYCRRGSGTPTHVALKPRLIACLPKTPSYCVCWHFALLSNPKAKIVSFTAVNH